MWVSNFLKSKHQLFLPCSKFNFQYAYSKLDQLPENNYVKALSDDDFGDMDTMDSELI